MYLLLIYTKIKKIKLKTKIKIKYDISEYDLKREIIEMFSYLEELFKNDSKCLITFIGYKKQSVNFGKATIYLSKIRSFHQKVLYQRIDTGKYFLYRFRIIVFSFDTFYRIFSLAQANGKNAFILDFCWGRSVFVVSFYFVSSF